VKQNFLQHRDSVMNLVARTEQEGAMFLLGGRM